LTCDQRLQYNLPPCDDTGIYPTRTLFPTLTPTQTFTDSPTANLTLTTATPTFAFPTATPSATFTSTNTPRPTLTPTAPPAGISQAEIEQATQELDFTPLLPDESLNAVMTYIFSDDAFLGESARPILQAHNRSDFADALYRRWFELTSIQIHDPYQCDWLENSM
jgi:hypothetical protein